MKVIFNLEKFQVLLRDFHRLTGLRVGVFNIRFDEVLAYPEHHSKFCAKVRAHDEGLSRCRACDAKAFEHAKNDGAVYVYTCHAGLTEAVAPIKGNAHTIGYLMIGQIQSQSAKPLIDSRDSIGIAPAPSSLPDFSADPNCMDEDSIHACARILQSCASSIWLSDYIRMTNESLSNRLERYINAELSSELSIAKVCAALGVGKTTLCACTKKYFGMTFSEVIRKRRIETARELLIRTDEPITQIAGKVGIGDYNYFSRLFKRETGIAPSIYRKSVLGE